MYSQKYCMVDYWEDYPRKEMVEIESTPLTSAQKQRLREGHSVSAPDRGGTYRQYFYPIPERS